jgi:hypothetical protein
MRFFGLLRFGKSGSVLAERGKFYQSGEILGSFLVAIFGGTRHLEPPSDRIGTRLQLFNPFRDGGNFARRFAHESPQLTLGLAIGAGEIRVDREPVFIGDDFCLLADFRQQKFCDFQRRFSPHLAICSGILDDAKQGVERLRTPVSDGRNHCGRLQALRHHRGAVWPQPLAQYWPGCRPTLVGGRSATTAFASAERIAALPPFVCRLAAFGP